MYGSQEGVPSDGKIIDIGVKSNSSFSNKDLVSMMNQYNSSRQAIQSTYQVDSREKAIAPNLSRSKERHPDGIEA